MTELGVDGADISPSSVDTEVLNNERYGDAADDGSGVQTLIDERGGFIPLPRGTYAVSSTLTMDGLVDARKLVGEGKENTIFEAQSDIAILELDSPNNTQGGAVEGSAGHWIEGIHFQGASGITHASPAISQAPTNNGVHFARIINNHFREVGQGIVFNTGSADNCIIAYNTVRTNGNSGDHGIVTSGGETSSEHTPIMGNVVLNADKAFSTGGGRNAYIGNTIEECKFGFYAVGQHHTYIGNVITETTSDAFFISGDNNYIAYNKVTGVTSGDKYHVGSTGEDNWIVAPGETFASITDQGTRTVLNGVGQNGSNDPASAGDWNGNGIEGVVVKWDDGAGTNFADMYIDGGWRQIATW